MNADFIPLTKETIQRMQESLDHRGHSARTVKLPAGCVHVKFVDENGKVHYCEHVTSHSNGFLCFRHERQVFGLPPIKTGAETEAINTPWVSRPLMTVLCEECGRDVPAKARVSIDHADWCGYRPSQPF